LLSLRDNSQGNRKKKGRNAFLGKTPVKGKTLRRIYATGGEPSDEKRKEGFSLLLGEAKLSRQKNVQMVLRDLRGECRPASAKKAVYLVQSSGERVTVLHFNKKKQDGLDF